MAKQTNRELIAELRRLVRYENAGFAYIGPLPSKDQELPKYENQATDFIRNRTRLYRESWIEPIVNELAKRLRVDDSAMGIDHE